MQGSETLLKLQEADLAEVRARRRLDELPEKRAILETRKKRTEVDGLRARAETFLGVLERDVAKHEDDVASVTEKLASEQARVMSGEVTNPKEVQSITREMDALKRRQDKLEMEELQLMEKVEKAKAQLVKIDEALSALDAREGKLTKEFKAKGGELQSEIDRTHKQREKLAKSLDANTRAAYERARESKGGIGVGVLQDGTCSACRVQLPAERVHALKAGPDTAQCPNCRRILVVRHGESK